MVMKEIAMVRRSGGNARWNGAGGGFGVDVIVLVSRWAIFGGEVTVGGDLLLGTNTSMDL
jgi:hypothetical protein